LEALSISPIQANAPHFPQTNHQYPNKLEKNSPVGIENFENKIKIFHKKEIKLKFEQNFTK